MRAGVKIRKPLLVAHVLAKYHQQDLTTTEIAKAHGVSTAAITVWAKKAGLPLRKRGRRPQSEPTPRQREIVALARLCKYDVVGAQFGMCKQSVYRIVKRWSNWPKTTQPPFGPGDVLLWKAKRLTVVHATCQEGILIDEVGRVHRQFTWSADRLPKKIGFNPKYMVPPPAAV